MIFKLAHTKIRFHLVGKANYFRLVKLSKMSRAKRVGFNSAITPSVIVSAARCGPDSEKFYKEAKMI